ncbi:MAG: uroporphyrinogen-III synthase [Cyanobacteria bacterium REEB67]|nr:uroporphyrinogen-III synthase [Cyanobacteria bacterium REEB67]
MWYHHPEKFLERLDGINILVTRSVDQADIFAGLLRDLGANVSEIPVLAITPPQDYKDLDRYLRDLPSYDWIVFASTNAVDYTVARAAALGLSDALKAVKLAVVGPSTAQAVTGHGYKVDFCPSAFVAETLIEEFPDYPHLQGKKIFWPRTNIGRTVIIDKFSEAGAQVDTAVAYLTDLPADHAHLARTLVGALRAGHIDVITLASAQSARNLASMIEEGLLFEAAEPGKTTTKIENNEEAMAMKSSTIASKEATMQELLGAVQIAAIGPVTARAARAELGRVDVEASDHTIIGLTKSLLASLKFPQKGT